MDCGPTCLRMIAKYYGRSFTNQTLRERRSITRSGVSLLGISEAAESIGFRSLGVQIPYEQLLEVPLPCILHWNQKHFVVLYKIKKDKFYIADPAGEKYKMNKEELMKCWANGTKNGELSGIALLLEPTPDFSSKCRLLLFLVDSFHIAIALIGLIVKNVFLTNIKQSGYIGFKYFGNFIQPVNGDIGSIFFYFHCWYCYESHPKGFMSEKIMNEIDLHGFQITLDGHRERHNKIRNNNGEPSYDKIIQNINLLCCNIKKIRITLRINYDNQTLKKLQAENILNDIQCENRMKIHIDLQRVWQTAENKDNAKDGISALISTAKAAGYKNVSCAGGLNA